MPAKIKYRLQPLLRLKERAKKKAEMALARALRKVEEEKVKLSQLEELRKKIQERRREIRADMREKMMTGQARIQQSQVHLGYMRKLDEDEEQLVREIDEQKMALEKAEEKVKRAKRDYMDAAYEHNVMDKHRELWLKKQAGILNALENKKMNELGNTVFQMNKMRGA